MPQKKKLLKYIPLKTFNTRVEAEILRGYLEGQSIKATITAYDEGGTSPFPFQPTSTGVKVLVPDQDIALARKPIQDKPSSSHTRSINKPLLFILVLILIYYLYLFIKNF